MQQAVCIRRKKWRKKKTKKSTPPGTHHESRSSPANATTSRRRAKKRPTRSPTFVRFHRCRVCGNRPRTAVAISKNKLFNVTHIPTDNLNTGTMYAPRYDDTFWPKGKRCPVSSLPRPFLITSRDVNEARRPHTCCRPCAFEEQKSNKTKTIKNTHCPKHNTISTAAWRPQPPRDGARRDTFYALAHILPLP